MPRKNRILFGLLVSSLALLGCNNTRDYTEYNYSPFLSSVEGVRISASMIGEYEDVPGDGRKTVRKNPYSLVISLSDTTLEFVSAKIKAVNVGAVQSGEVITLSALPVQKEFAPNYKSEGSYARFLADDIELNEEDYDITLIVEICDDTKCKEEEVTGTLKLEIKKYQSNDAIDKLLSP